MHLLYFLSMSILLRIADGFTLKGSSGPLVVPLGGSVVLPCSVDSLLSLEDLEVEWRRSDSQTLIHLYQDEDIRPEAQHQDYHDRAHFFTEDIKHGNFSLLLNNLTAEDEGQYTCKVYIGHESGEAVVEIKHVERLIVSGSSRSISASVGDDVTLSCSVNSHIKPEEIEEVSWKRTNKGEPITVLLYQYNETLSDASDERYRDRVEFFTDEIHRGNFSLRLKRVTTEDKGVYICQVFTGRLSANKTVIMERLGLSDLHILVLILCITACGSALLFCSLIYCKPNTGFIVEGYNCVHFGDAVVLPCFIDPCLIKEDLKVEWSKSGLESPVCVYEDGDMRPEVQHQDYHDRAHFLTEKLKHGDFSLLLKNLKKEDAGQYTCKVYTGQRSVFSVSVSLKHKVFFGSWFSVEHSSDLVVPLGGSVVLPCSVDLLLPLEDLEVEWRRSDLKNPLCVYQDEDIRAEAQHQDYHDRAHFFTEDIKHGNFSLLLNNLTAEDEGQYTCKVHTGQESNETVVEIKHERLIVSGSNKSISAYVGDDVTLSCSVNSHIKPEEIEEVSWKKTDKERDIPVLLYQDNEVLPDASDEQYRDRVEFFTDEIHRGNFSLRLKRVRSEDKGVYICQVFTGRLSANTTVILQQLGFSALHIIVLILCITACGCAVIMCFLIYCRPKNMAKHVKTLGYIHVFLPNIIMLVAFVLWGVTEGFLNETILCCALCLLRPLMLTFVAPYLKDISGSRLLFEFILFTAFYFSVLLKHAWDASVHYAGTDRVMIVVLFAVVILFIVGSFIYKFSDELNISCPGKMCDGEICTWIVAKFKDLSEFSFFFLPSLQFSLFFFAFGAAGNTGILVSTFFPVFFFMTFVCLAPIKKEKKSCPQLLLKTTWMIFMFIFNAVMVYLCVTSLENKTDAAGWSSTSVFSQVLWMIIIYIIVDKKLDVPYKKILYVFGSVGVVLFNAVALMTELILKTINGDRAVGDLRSIVCSSESLFSLTVLIFSVYEPWINDIKCLQSCKNAESPDEYTDTD